MKEAKIFLFSLSYNSNMWTSLSLYGSHFSEPNLIGDQNVWVTREALVGTKFVGQLTIIGGMKS